LGGACDVRAALFVAVAAVAVAVDVRAQDDLGGGAPLAGPSAADLGDTKAPTAPTEAPPADAAPPRKKKKSTSTTTPPTTPTKPTTTTTPTTTTASSEKPAAGADLERAAKLRADIDAALLALPADDKATRALRQQLDALNNVVVSDAVYAADPALKALHRLVRVRLTVVDDRLDDADTALKDARAAADAVSAKLDGAPGARLQAAVRFAAAFVAEQRARKALFADECGSALGLATLAANEARQKKKILDDVTARYRPLATGPDKLWGRRAAYQTTALFDDVARLSLRPANYRGVALPAPLAVDAVDGGALLTPFLTGWFAELRRSFAQLSSSIDARSPDAALAEALRVRTAELAALTLPAAEAITPLWRSELREGVVRLATRAERMNAAGRFVPVDARSTVAALQKNLERPLGSVEHAYAMVGLARAAPDKVDTAVLLAALGHSDARVVVSGLLAVEAAVAASKGGGERAVAVKEAVVAAYAAADKGARAAPFSTLQGALFGRAERALLALRAIARADRATADALVGDDRLPALERAWFIAELADQRFAQRFDNWGWDKDDRVAALAIYGGVTARGNFAGYLRRPTAPGLVGCVSRATTPP
jgi:hypothetical protein